MFLLETFMGNTSASKWGRSCSVSKMSVIFFNKEYFAPG